MVMAFIWAEAMSMNRSRMSRGTPISSVISAAGMRPTVVTKSVSAPGSTSSMSSSAISPMRSRRLRTRLGRSAVMRTRRISPWRGGSASIRLSNSGSPIESLAWAIVPRVSAGPRSSSRSRAWAHSGSWCSTVDGSLASPMANPKLLENSSGWLPTKRWCSHFDSTHSPVGYPAGSYQ
jgi:hypothetical protein